MKDHSMTLSKNPSGPGPSGVAAQAAPKTSVSLFSPVQGASVGSALAAMVAASSEGGAVSPFPVLTISMDGALVPAPFVEQAIADQLPQGKKPFEGVFMGYRLAVSSWAVGYNDAQPVPGAAPAPAGTDQTKPVWSCALAANNQADAVALVRCGRKYQYTPGGDRAKFDHAVSGVGHVRPQVEILVFVPELNDLVVVSTPSNFGAVEATLEGLQRLVDPATGAVGQFPASLRPMSEDKTSKKSGRSWKVHRLDVTSITNQASPAWAKYQGWLAGASQDPAIVQTVRQWLAAEDRPITDDIRKALTMGASL
jgi:hypothetical protein